MRPRHSSFLKRLMNIFPVYLDSFEVCVERRKLQCCSGIVYSWQNKFIKMKESGSFEILI